jgi:hypothetical protein
MRSEAIGWLAIGTWLWGGAEVLFVIEDGRK